MQRRLLISYIILTIIAVGITGIFSIRINEKNYKAEVEQRLLSNCKAIKRVISDRLIEGHALDYNVLAGEYSKEVDARITIIDVHGKVLGESSEGYEYMDRHDDRPEIIAAIKEGYGKSIRYSDTINMDFMYVAVPVYTDGDITGIVRLSIPLDRINAMLRNMWASITIVVIIAFGITTIQAYRFSRDVTKPIKELRDISNIMAEGNFENRVKVNTKDEISELAETFNYMACRLKTTIDELTEKSINLEAILKSMINGIIAVDSDNRVMLINEAAYDLFNIKGLAKGKNIIEVARDSNLVNMIDKALKEGKPSSTEVLTGVYNERYLSIHVSPIKKEENDSTVVGAVALMQDITEIRKLEQVRKDFVANVSHEIKTPLTSIKGFVETLKEGAIEDSELSRRFLEIIDIESERLSRLIDDILVLSEIEGKTRRLDETKTDICAVAEDVLNIMEEQANKKNIQLTFQHNYNKVFIKVGRDRIKQMLINLVDNAVKYTPEQGKVDIYIRKSKDIVIIGVKDNGIGIQKEHIPRLFERFYRVDKGRSRRLGGTGLGLAIVKHIAKSMNAEIKVESKPGKGTEFTIKIPLK